MSNVFKYIIQTSMWCIIAGYVRPESVIQTFLAESGVIESKIALVVTFMQVFQTAFILLLSPVADKTKNVIKAISISLFLCFPMLLFLILNCFTQSIGGNVSFVILIILSVIAQIGVAFFHVYIFKLAYHIMDINEYGKIQSRASVAGGVAAFVSSFLMTMALSRFSYFPVMAWVYFIVIVSILIFFVSTYTMKRVGCAPVESNKKINIFKYPPFYKLIIPNIARGFAVGAMYMMATVGYYYDILSAASAGVLLVLPSVSGILISFFFPALQKRIGLKELFLAGSVISLFSMPMMIATKSVLVFLIFYGISFMSVTIMDISIPVALTKLIDYEVAGTYSGYRMMLQALGTSLFTATCVFLLDNIGGIMTLILAASLQLFAGIAYYRCLKEKENN